MPLWNLRLVKTDSMLSTIVQQAYMSADWHIFTMKHVWRLLYARIAKSCYICFPYPLWWLYYCNERYKHCLVCLHYSHCTAFYWNFSLFWMMQKYSLTQEEKIWGWSQSPLHTTTPIVVIPLVNKDDKPRQTRRGQKEPLSYLAYPMISKALSLWEVVVPVSMCQ